MNFFWALLWLFVGFAVSATLLRYEGTFRRLELAVVVATLVIMVSTVLFGLEQVRVSEGNLQNEQFTRLMEGIGNTNVSSRIMALYGLEGYTAIHPDTRTQILHVLAAHIRVLDRGLDHRASQDEVDELRIAAGVLLNVSRFNDSADNLLSYDLSNVALRDAPMPGLKSEASYFIGTGFSGVDLSGSSWTCSDLRSANFGQSNLDGSQFVGVDVSGTDFRGARLENVKFDDIHWDIGKAPIWPQGFTPPVESIGDGNFDQETCKKDHDLVKGP